ncbi:DUF1405 domain-containing protein [Paenibacillus hunanensis]|uniref:DUF1405 domain-containing protein n=1 Tax=Paenibacillus hunanensis TaxID=539262 RepID=UPI002025CE6C|nr:DUF1405 domain-containing protein [Paenibacillus hunanensis]MCL9662868.1 DUF1405 domain-containing protein [Paenibacillus hunanensis]
MPISYFWSRAFLTNRWLLWLLLICNVLGTIYGYYWYALQLEYTLLHWPSWMIVFVPDSPTASLFFSIAIAFLLFPPRSRWLKGIRALFEALAVVTSVKYGVWAVTMIFWGAALGDTLVWQDWMLTASHLTMAIEALIYVRFFIFRHTTLVLALGWTLLNDYMDYSQGIYPWLTEQLVIRLNQVRNFTVSLTLASALAGAWALWQAREDRKFNNR